MSAAARNAGVTSPVLVLGDCVAAMAAMEPSSIDAIVTDPPYGLEFMGKGWDRLDGDARKMQAWHERWAREALRVLKPGGYLVAFGGTRTYHRLACAVEDAGFEIRDRVLVEGVEVDHPTELAWMYGEGFPKSRDVSKAIDAAAGAEREVVSEGRPVRRMIPGADQNDTGSWIKDNGREFVPTVTEAATEDAARWEGWGTALKPAHEPIVVARKPLGERNVAANVLRYGVGAINVDATRVDARGDALGGGDQSSATKQRTEGWDRPWMRDEAAKAAHAGRVNENVARAEALGRWPANVVLVHGEGCVRVGTRRVPTGTAVRENVGKSGSSNIDFAPGNPEMRENVSYGEGGAETVEAWECVEGCPVRTLDEQSGATGGGLRQPEWERARSHGSAYGEIALASYRGNTYGDTGGASRFFYCAKASVTERHLGLDGLEAEFAPTMGDGIGAREHNPETATKKLNTHPTVKPVELMRWLVRLVVPPGGLVLDPFLGSGTTGIAAGLEGARFVGVERDAGYLRIAVARIVFWGEHGEDAVAVVRARERSAAARRELAEVGQLSLDATPA